MTTEVLNLKRGQLFLWNGECYAVIRHELDGVNFTGVSWVRQLTIQNGNYAEFTESKFNSYAPVEPAKVVKA